MKKNYEIPMIEVIEVSSELLMLNDSGINNGNLYWDDEADFEI